MDSFVIQWSALNNNEGTSKHRSFNFAHREVKIASHEAENILREEFGKHLPYALLQRRLQAAFAKGSAKFREV